MSRISDKRELQRIAEEMGFRYEGMTANGHLRWRHSSGRLAITGSSLNDAPRTRKNVISLLRKTARGQEQRS